MSKIHTYYDNLKVSRNAPSEVIRAAYKSLAVKYHPDRNLSNKDDATRVMALINEAYEVLSDVEKRKQHDIWIKEQENPKIKNDVIQPSSGTDNISEIIKQKREEKGLSVEELSSQTMLSIAIIKDLENGNFDHYQGEEAYMKMYLRKICRALDINEKEVQNEYLNLTQKIELEELQ